MSMSAVGLAPVIREYFTGGWPPEFNEDELEAEDAAQAEELAAVLDGLPAGVPSGLGRVDCEVAGGKKARLLLGEGWDLEKVQGIWAQQAACPFAPGSIHRVWWLRGYAATLRAAEDEILAGV